MGLGNEPPFGSSDFNAGGSAADDAAGVYGSGSSSAQAPIPLVPTSGAEAQNAREKAERRTHVREALLAHFRRIANDNRNLQRGLDASSASEENNRIKKGLDLKSDKLDTVFGYNFEYPNEEQKKKYEEELLEQTLTQINMFYDRSNEHSHFSDQEIREIHSYVKVAISNEEDPNWNNQKLVEMLSRGESLKKLSLSILKSLTKTRKINDQALYPNVNSNATYLGGVRAWLRGPIILSRSVSRACELEDPYLIYSYNKEIYTISFEDLDELLTDDDKKSLNETDQLADATRSMRYDINALADIEKSKKTKKIEIINSKLKSLGITHYGWADEKTKKKLIPHKYLPYVDAFLTSLIALPLAVLGGPWVVISPMISLGLFLFRLYPQIRKLNYQDEHKGVSPTFHQMGLLNQDGMVMGAQMTFTAVLSALLMNEELHQAGWSNLGKMLVDSIAVAAGMTLSTIAPWVPFVAALVFGVALGLTLVGVALFAKKYLGEKDEHQYTPKQLAVLFGLGFAGGAMMTALPFMIPNSGVVSSVFMYLIDIGVSFGLFQNMQNRLKPKDSELLTGLRDVLAKSSPAPSPAGSSHNAPAPAPSPGVEATVGAPTNVMLRLSTAVAPAVRSDTAERLNLSGTVAGIPPL